MRGLTSEEKESLLRQLSPYNNAIDDRQDLINVNNRMVKRGLLYTVEESGTIRWYITPMGLKVLSWCKEFQA